MNTSSQPKLGFSLIEVTLALGVAAISLMAIFGLLVTGTQTNHTAVEQSSSSDILTAVAADLRATPRTSSTSTQFGISIPAAGTVVTSTLFFNSQGKGSLSPVGDSRYRLTIKFLANGGAPRTATFVDLRMTWPALPDPSQTQYGNLSAAETFVALDRN